MTYEVRLILTYEVDMSEEQRRRGFMKAEASLRLEGIDPSGSPHYESVKARIISGEITGTVANSRW